MSVSRGPLCMSKTSRVARKKLAAKIGFDINVASQTMLRKVENETPTWNGLNTPT